MDAILGTAGHIDHGKTSLIAALTGINCDRLAEEKRRGITIELGFAWLDLPDKRRLGIIDVPGHEKFVKNMVAGAAGIDCMLLVIAADEGIMPQTREHLDICTLLGVETGLIALTKTDMVDEDWLEMVKEDVSANLKRTFLENSPILPVSSANGAGIKELREAIFEVIKSIRPKSRPDILRLPVDRVFTLKGFGTVVTGTLISGNLRQGEDVAIMPSGKQARARSIQVHSTQVTEAHSSQRVAINLQNCEVSDIDKGDIIARPNTLFPSRRWIVQLDCLPSSPLPIRQRMEVHFHHGSKECSCRIMFKDRTELRPGEAAIAELHFPEALAGVFGDRCVMRAHSPLRTIAGGILLDPMPKLLRKREPLFAHKLEGYNKLADLQLQKDKSQEILLTTLDLRDAPGVNEKELTALTGLPRKEIAECLSKAQEEGKAICWDRESKSWLGIRAFNQALDACRKRGCELHEREPLKSSFAYNAFCSGWGDNLPPRFTNALLEEAVRLNILKMEGNGIKLADYEIKLSDEQAANIEKLLALYEQAAFSPPLLKEAAEKLSLDIKQLMPLITHLSDAGRIIKIQEGLYYPASFISSIKEQIKAWFQTHESLDISDMKEAFSISRKYAIPLLEYLDSIKLTTRVGNQRQLAKK